VVPEADWVRMFQLNEEPAGLSDFDELSLMDWLVASHLNLGLLL
jgi:hypothetical protein